MVDVHYPDAETVVRVLDQHSIRSPASLYEAFPPAKTKRLADKRKIQHAPKHSSWLNMAEPHLRPLQWRCLGRRIGIGRRLEDEAAAWLRDRNAAK